MSSGAPLRSRYADVFLNYNPNTDRTCLLCLLSFRRTLTDRPRYLRPSLCTGRGQVSFNARVQLNFNTFSVGRGSTGRDQAMVVLLL